MYIMQYISYELLQRNDKLSQMKTKTPPVGSKNYLLQSQCYLLFHVSNYLDSLFLFYVVLVNNCVLLNIRIKSTVFIPSSEYSYMLCFLFSFFSEFIRELGTTCCQAIAVTEATLCSHMSSASILSLNILSLFIFVQESLVTL